jgi:hypothetical protein
MVKRTKRLVCLPITTILSSPVYFLLCVLAAASKVMLSDTPSRRVLWDEDTGCRRRREIYYLHQEHSEHL